MPCTLGIDIGTSKVAAVARDLEGGATLASASFSSAADLDAGAGRGEQDVGVILAVVAQAVKALDPGLRREVRGVGVTGQMHGVMLWGADGRSPLYTWKDKRGSSDGSLAAFAAKVPGHKLRDGFGSATLAWLAANDGLAGWEHAATIHDYLVYRLTGAEAPVTDPSDAASWGLFDLFASRWDLDAAAKLGIPRRFFPKVVKPGSMAGRLADAAAAELGLTAGVAVMAATGDNQASVFSTAGNWREELYFTLGTGGQLSAVVPAEQVRDGVWPDTVELRPYFDDAFLAVAAPLCGGQAFAWLVDSVAGFLSDLDLPPVPRVELFQRLDALAMASSRASGLRVKPNFLGERHAPGLRGGVEGIGLDNFKLGDLAAELALGIVTNAKNMMPDTVRQGKKQVVCSGNAIRRLRIVQDSISRVFGLPLLIKEAKEEAAEGAAKLAAR